MSTNNQKKPLSTEAKIIIGFLIMYGVISSILPFLDLTPMSFAEESALTKAYGALWYLFYLMYPDYFK